MAVASAAPNLSTKPHTLASRLTPDRLTFIDLFAGIGGFRLGLERLGWRCQFSCEWDRYCQRTYQMWFGQIPVGDIREVAPTTLVICFFV